MNKEFDLSKTRINWIDKDNPKYNCYSEEDIQQLKDELKSIILNDVKSIEQKILVSGKINKLFGDAFKWK